MPVQLIELTDRTGVGVGRRSKPGPVGEIGPASRISIIKTNPAIRNPTPLADLMTAGSREIEHEVADTRRLGRAKQTRARAG